MTTCKNGDHIFEGNFCNNCGQSAHTHRINIHFLWHDIQHGLLHFDQGMAFSIKEMFLRPGHSVREFIAGKRVQHFSPISLLLVVGTLYGVIYHMSEIELMKSDQESKIGQWIEHLMATHYSWIMLFTLPFYTLGTYWCFKNQGYNFMEYLVLNAFEASQRIFVHLLTFPLLYFANGTQLLSQILQALLVVDFLLLYWTNEQFFNKLPKWEVFWRTLLGYLIFLTLITLLLSLVLVIEDID